MKKEVILKDKLRKNPYKGVLSEIAKEQGVSPQAIWTAVYKSRNIRIMEILSMKMRQRKQHDDNINNLENLIKNLIK